MSAAEEADAFVASVRALRSQAKATVDQADALLALLREAEGCDHPVEEREDSSTMTERRVRCGRCGADLSAAEEA